MQRNQDRILVTHAGALPRSEALRALVFARAEGEPHDAALLAKTLRDEVAGAVRKQIACGIDVVNGFVRDKGLKPFCTTCRMCPEIKLYNKPVASAFKRRFRVICVYSEYGVIHVYCDQSASNLLFARVV